MNFRIFSVLFLLAGSAAHGVTSQFDLLLDLDANGASGCTVATPAGPFHGVESILTTHVETSGVDQAEVILVERRDCTDPAISTFGPPQTVSADGWPVGIGNGEAGFNVIETYLPITPAQRFEDIRIGVVATDELGNSSVLLTVSPDSTSSIHLHGLPHLPIPLAGKAALLLLSLLLLAAGIIVIRRRGRLTLVALVCLSAGGVAGAACVLDGEIFNWSAEDLLAHSAATDPGNGVDIRALFGKRAEGENQLCFRIDAALVFANMPVAVDDEYIVVETNVLNRDAGTGLLANDNPGIPAGELVSFGGGGLGGAVTDHAAGATVNIGADGSLTVNADGSFQFQAETGFEGAFAFLYRLENLVGVDTATVTVEVQSTPVAVDDAYEVVIDETLDLAAPGVLVNDSGLPEPVVASFGGGSLGGTVDDHAAGASAAIAPDGSVTLNADGSLVFVPAGGLTGDFSFTYRIENDAGDAQATITVTVNVPPAVTSADNHTCEAGSACDFTFTADGFPEPTITIDGALPDGVNFDAGTDSLEGIPVAGTGAQYDLTVTADNGVNPAATQAFILTVNEAPTITSADSLGCEVGEPCSFTFTADGFPDPTFELPGLPAGLSLNAATGELSGTADAGTGGVHNLTLTAQNTLGSDTQNFTLTVGQAPTITSADNLTCQVGDPCAFTFAADGFPDPTFSLPGLPAGLSLNATTGELSGTPDAGTGAEYNLTLTAANGVTPDATQAFTLTINEAPAITSADNLTCQVGSACDFTFTADGFPDPTFSLPGLPAGLSLNATTGVLSGTPDANSGAVYNLTLTAANGIGADDTQAFTLTINEAPTITSADNLTCQVGSACNFTFTADGFPDPGFSLPGLPAGLSLNATTGELSGTPDAATGAEHNLTLTAANGVTPDATQAFTLTINEAPAITSADNLTCQVGSACDFTFTADGFPDPSFSLPGLPAGLSLNATTGVLSGTPDANSGAVYNLTLTAANGIGADDTHAFTLTINEAPTITSADNLTCQVGSACNFTFTADGFPDPGFSLPGLPAGLSLNATTGELSGTPDAGTGAEYNLTLTAANGVTPDATQAFTLTINEVPQANNDPEGGIPGNSSPGSMAYHGAFDTTLNVSAGNGVLANDILGFPTAGIVTPSPIPTTAGGSVTLGADGGFSYSPPTGFTGIDTFQYCIENAAAQSCATVEMAIGERPSAADASYPQTLIGNVGIDTSVDSGFSVTAGGDGISLGVSSTTNGDAVLNANGTFTFNPAAGVTSANGLLEYSVSNGFGSATGTITIPIGADRIWFADNSAAAGDGRLSTPFNTLAAVAAAAASTNEQIFLFTGSADYTGGITLLDGQRLLGQAGSQTLAAMANVTPPTDSVLPATGGTAPVIVNGGGNGVTLASGNRLQGFAVGNTSAVGISGNAFGTLTVLDVSIAGTGQALDLAGGSVTGGGFASVSSSSGTRNVLLTNITGTLNLGGGSLTGASTSGFEVNGGTATINYGGSITTTGTVRPVRVLNRTAATLTLSGAITGANGILLTDNTGSTIVFQGALTLNTDANIAFEATGGGTITASGTGSTLQTTTATALRVVDTAIGAGNLTFQAISAGTAATGPTNGIVLNNTGTAGGLRVTGTGTAGSGGLIRNTSDVSVLLLSTANVELVRLNVTGSGNDGIRGQGVHNFALVGANLTDNGNATGENGLQFGAPSGTVAGITGTLTITDTTISGSAGNNVHIRNTSGTLDAMNVSGSNFNDISDVTGANSFLFEMSGTAVTTAATVSGSTFANNSPQRALEVQAHDAGTISGFTVSGNTFNDNGIHTSFTQDTTANLTFSMLNNNMQFADPLHAINVFSSAISTGGSITGTIQGNVIGDAAVASSGAGGNGIRVVIQGQTQAVLLIDNNTLRQIIGGRGITASFRGPTTSGLPITQSDITITNNDVDTMAPGSSFPLAAIFLAADDQGSPARVRADIRNNTAVNSVAGGSWDYPTFDGNGVHLIFVEEGGAAEEGQLIDTLNGPDATTQMDNNNTATVFASGITLIPGPINTP